MKQVNFKELNVEYGVDKFQKADLTHEIGDAIIKSAESVPMYDLAHIIYHSTGAIEISDNDYQQMMKIICTSFKIIIAKAVEAGTTEVETKDKEE
jgi:hypothetical protein|nr:MAG TPA: hypothetical protein [Caudoviricetes sp.]